MTLDEILYNIMDDYETDELAPTRKKEVCDYFISLLPKEVTYDDMLTGETITDSDQANGYNMCIRYIKERIEKEMGNDQA